MKSIISHGSGGLIALFLVSAGAYGQPGSESGFDFADLIERVSPAVVSVSVVTESPTGSRDGLFEQFRSMPGFDEFMRRYGVPGDRDSAPRMRRGRSSGSGFFISERGYIVTNNHVVNNAREARVRLSDGSEYDARIVGTDPQTDLAVLKIDAERDLPFVSFSTQGVPRVGEWVVAVGNPFNLGGTATVGIVSAIGREMGGAYADYIQIDAAINRGNSGGPAFNLRGEVVGVNTAIVSPTGGSVGIGFAIEAGPARRIVETLIRDGQVPRGWLGVSIQSLTDEMVEARGLDSDSGAIVAEVVEDSPAEAGGLRRGDIILSVNGKRIEDSRHLTRTVATLKAGTRNRFGIFRDGRQKTVKVTVGERPDGSGVSLRRSARVLGGHFGALDSDQKESLGLRSSESGLVVTSLERDSVLAEAGVSVGDALLEANGDELEEVSDLTEAIERARAVGKSNILLAVRKARQTLFLTVDISGG